MDCIFPHHLLQSNEHILILIGLVTLEIVILQQVTISLGDSLISWQNKKQSVVSRSSTESEYHALADTTAELLWLCWFLHNIGVPFSTSIPIYPDNQSAIQIPHNDLFHELRNTQRLTIISFNAIFCNSLSLLPFASANQIADLFTKSLSPGQFHILVSKLKVVNSSWFVLYHLEFEWGC